MRAICVCGRYFNGCDSGVVVGVEGVCYCDGGVVVVVEGMCGCDDGAVVVERVCAAVMAALL